MSPCEDLLLELPGHAARGRTANHLSHPQISYQGLKGDLWHRAGSASAERGVGGEGDTGWYMWCQRNDILPDGKITVVAEMQGWISRLNILATPREAETACGTQKKKYTKKTHRSQDGTSQTRTMKETKQKTVITKKKGEKFTWRSEQ